MTRLALAALGMLAACSGAVVGGCADAPADRSDRAALALFLRYAGPPVASFPYPGHYNGFRPLGDRELAVWTTMDQAWLITVSPPCPRLAYANGLGLTSDGHRITRGIDWVRFDHGRCRIQAIRPVDYHAMKQAGVAGP